MTDPALATSPAGDPEPPVQGGDGGDAAFCRAMLPRVSRTFAIGIRLLPAALSRPVGVAYLICRIADTLEDSTDHPLEERRALLAELDRALTDPAREVPASRRAFRSAGAAAPDARLVAEADRVLREFRRLPAGDRLAITPWVREMIRGMGLSLQPGREALTPACERIEDLEEYCYFVAGTVGHLLTGLFGRHVAGLDAARLARLEEMATGFGLGLQLTNVLRDMPQDHREGRSFVPVALCREAGVRPDQLFTPGHEETTWEVLSPLLARAARHLDTALAYSITLPRSAIRVRLFCLSSLCFARRTLTLLAARREETLRGGRIRMPRYEVFLLLGLLAVIAPFNGLVTGVYRRLGGGVEQGGPRQGSSHGR